MKKIKMYVVGVVFVLWTLMCVYGTYYNTVQHAHLIGADAPYQIEYDNTHEIHDYLPCGKQLG